MASATTACSATSTGATTPTTPRTWLSAAHSNAAPRSSGSWASRPPWYDPIYPVWIVGDDPARLEFTLALDAGQRLVQPGEAIDDDTRAYLTRLTKQRLHQRVFRSQILVAYDRRCAVCNLGHVDLLDAAHIIADGQPHGQPVTPNGLAMCKIHHAAFDAGILGVRPDLSLHVRQDILDEIDGPMLRHGLQEMHNQRLMKVPSVRASHPDRSRLEERYAEFLAFG